MVDENRFEGAARNIGGKVQDAVGGLTGDASTQLRGKANQAQGTVQGMYGQAIDELTGFASDQPILALASALGVGIVLGFILGRR